MSEWIPVAERLPPIKFNQAYGETEIYLVVHDGRMVNPEAEPGNNSPFNPLIGIGRYVKDRHREYWAVSNDAGRYFGCIFEDEDSYRVHGKVTHWMPLPSAPEKRSTDDESSQA